jgi:hypothetical protein
MREEEEYPVSPNPEDSDFYEMRETDEVLEEMREERQLDNDRWQSILFRDQQSGTFTGTYELYEPQVRDGRLGLLRRDSGQVCDDIKSIAFI